MLAGTLLLNVPANTLFDTSASISVISVKCASSLHLLEAYMIRTAGTQYLFSNESSQGCLLSLGSLQVHPNLLILDTPTYDVILAMDWLAKNDVQMIVPNDTSCFLVRLFPYLLHQLL